MSIYIFKCREEPLHFQKSMIKSKFEATNFDTVIEAFEDFLRGSGFGAVMEGRRLELVDRES